MTSELRTRTAERMVEEMLGYLIEKILPGAELGDPAWEAMAGPDRAMMLAIAAYERGEISFEELEDEGVRYVEAWEGVAGQAKSS